ncbi:MAG: EscU/YscU/HrcU family type III secretion system export apparatus switch protein [Treponema sp.]|nr:EscU/YscU/HrcU family type III secretion system export apparatus switch protein [Treponema sp.]
MKNQKKIQFKSLNHDLSIIRQCDIILTNGTEQFVGLYYNEQYYNSPMVLCKGNGTLNYYLSKVTKMFDIPCIEEKPLTRELYEGVKQGEEVPLVYWKMVATIYSKLKELKPDKEHSDFRDKLNRDLCHQIDAYEKRVYQKTDRNFLKTHAVCDNLYQGEVVRLFHTELRDLAEKCGVNFRSNYNTAFKTDEFYLESRIEEYDLELWQMVFVNSEEQEICIFTKNLFKKFPFSSADLALEFVKALVEVCNKDVKPSALEYCTSSEINPKLCEIAQTTIRTMLEMNFNKKGIIYGLSYDTVVCAVYLEKKEYDIVKEICSILNDEQNSDNTEKPRKMYEIVISNTEIIKHPYLVKEAIEDPKVFKKYHFWCKEKKFNQKYFEEKFWTIEP